MSKKTVLIILSLILIVVSIVYMGVKSKDEFKQGIIDQFKADALSASMQFDDELANGKENYDFVSQYIIGTSGYAVLLDAEMLIIAHPNTELIGITMPILVIEEKVKESLSTNDGEDLFVLYVYDGVEHMAYIHNLNNEVILIILDRIAE